MYENLQSSILLFTLQIKKEVKGKICGMKQSLEQQGHLMYGAKVSDDLAD